MAGPTVILREPPASLPASIPRGIALLARPGALVLRGWRGTVDRLPGLSMVGALAVAATALGKVSWLQANGISPLTIAIVLGMVVGNSVHGRFAATAASGVWLSKQILLRAGIVLYGLRLTFQDIAEVGMAGVIIDAITLGSTFALSWWFGTRVLKLDRRTALLIGAGSSICGAAAVMAAAPVVRGRAEQVTVAVSTVVVFGTLAIFLYPAFYHFAARHPAFALSPTAYGIYAGSTIHEVAQVVAAGRAVAAAAANTAVITKMVRVMMLAPFLIGLSAYLSRNPERSDATRGNDTPKGTDMPEGTDMPDRTNTRDRTGAASRGALKVPVVVPWFALGFVAVAGLNSLAILPRPVVGAGIGIDTVILAMAMAALGVTTHVSAIRTAGVKPLALAALLFAWLIVGGFAINAGVSRIFS